MPRERISIHDFLQLPEEEQVGNGVRLGAGGTCGAWYDWFCTDKALVSRGRALVKKLDAIKDSKRFNIHSTYVFFKNNCPVSGNLYDDFRICDIRTGDVIFTIVPKSGHTSMKGAGEVWGRDEDNNFKCLFNGTWKEIKQWFLHYQNHNPHFIPEHYRRPEDEIE